MLACSLLLLLLSGSSRAAPQPDGWTFEAKSGMAYNLPMPVRFTAAGEPESSWWATFKGHPFDTPFYYSYRLGRWKSGRAWEFETLHHKVFITNPEQYIQQYQVTHGYNEWLVNRAWDRPDGAFGGHILRFGLGIVLAHPEGLVHGLSVDERGGWLKGYHIAGPAAQAALEKRWRLWKGLFLDAECKATFALARIPLYLEPMGSRQGEADIPNAALHILVGVGYAF